MSTLAEIEAAVVKLARPEKEELLHFLSRQLQDEQRLAASDIDIAELERRNGFDVFPRRKGSPVTIETVRQICAEDGI